MNDLKALTGSIIDQAKAEAAQITAQAAVEVEKMLSQAQQQAQERSRKLAEAYQQRAEAAERRLAIEAELEGKKRILAAKRALIEEAFTEATVALQKLPPAQRVKFLVGKLADAGAENGGEVQTVGEQSEWQTIVNEANELLARSGKLAQLKLSSKAAPTISNGFRLIGPGYAIDGSYQALISEVKEMLLPEVANYLFAATEE
jgi:V/A-type H+-transporting ATPase subunit E